MKVKLIRSVRNIRILKQNVKEYIINQNLWNLKSKIMIIKFKLKIKNQNNQIKISIIKFMKVIIKKALLLI